MKIKNVNIFADVLQASESVTLIDIQINTQSWFTTLLVWRRKYLPFLQNIHTAHEGQY